MPADPPALVVVRPAPDPPALVVDPPALVELLLAPAPTGSSPRPSTPCGGGAGWRTIETRKIVVAT